MDDKENLQIFVTLNDHFATDDYEVKHFAIQLIGDILPHLEPRIQDACMSKVVQNLVPCLGSNKIATRKLAVQVLQVYLRCTTDLHSLLRNIVVYGLEHRDPSVVHEVRKETVIKCLIIESKHFGNLEFQDKTLAQNVF